jgi:hypothetical protein
MATLPPDKTSRDANLNALLAAVQEWGQKEKTRLDNETLFLRSVLTGRGATAAGDANLEQAVSALKEEIDQYVLFGSIGGAPGG